MFGIPKLQTIIAGGLLAVILALTVALFIANGNTKHWQKLDAQHAAALDMEVSKNVTNLKSIADLTDAINAKNAETEARAKAYADAKASDAAIIDGLDKQYASTKASRDALAAIAKVAGNNPACKVPAALSGALEGL